MDEIFSEELPSVDNSFSWPAPAQTDTGNAFSDFFNTARSRLSGVMPSTSGTSGPTLGSQLMDAIYAYGSGKVSVARDRAVKALLGTNEGQKLQASATKQTLIQYAPYIIVGALLLVTFGFLARR